MLGDMRVQSFWPNRLFSFDVKLMTGLSFSERPNRTCYRLIGKVSGKVLTKSQKTRVHDNSTKSSVCFLILANHTGQTNLFFDTKCSCARFYGKPGSKLLVVIVALILLAAPLHFW